MTEPSIPEERPVGTRRALLYAILRTLRLEQWVKNGVVFVPWFFAIWDHAQAVAPLNTQLLPVLQAAIAFGMVSSGIYTLNDLCDAEQDRRHPEKCHRPIAAGELSHGAASVLLAVLIAGGLSLAYAVNTQTFAILGAYTALNVGYSSGLKHVALLDVFIIAAGFVLRATAGATAVTVRVSPWLLLCTFLLALFLACCKRRHEKAHLDAGGNVHRLALAGYDLRALDQYISITAAAAIICYAVYTLAPETLDKFGTSALGFTVPFVIFGIFRYMDLTYRLARGERPDKAITTDLPLIITVILYAATAVAAFVWGKMK